MIRKLFDDYGIRYIETGNHHCRPGWVQVCCPMCIDGDSSYHMGYNLKQNTGFTCYRCGGHSSGAVLSRLLSVSIREASTILRRYVKQSKEAKQDSGTAENSSTIRRCKLPVMREIVKGDNLPYNYLKARFCHLPEAALIDLIQFYQLSFTDWKDSLMPCRIIIPAFKNGEIVSYQGRDYTGLSRARYLDSKPENEICNLKEMVWGLDDVPLDSVMICEGPFDAMTIGPGAVHLGGISFTDTQVKLLQRFKKAYIVFDSEMQARRQARKLANRIGLHTQVRIVKIEGHDINSASVKEIEQLKGLVQ